MEGSSIRQHGPMTSRSVVAAPPCRSYRGCGLGRNTFCSRAQDRVHETQLVELLEDQANHPAGLLVRLLDDLTRRRLEVPPGHRQEQLAALRLVPAATQQ